MIRRSTRVKLVNPYKPSPEGTKRCSRPYKFGNEFTVEKYGLDECLRLYEEDLIKKLREDPGYLDELKGKNGQGLKLACYCAIRKPCHVDIILKYLYRNDYTAINWEGLTDQQVSKALDRILSFSLDKRRETDFAVSYIYDSDLKENRLCQECHKKLTGRQENWCSQECGDKFSNRFWWQRIRYNVWERDEGKCKKCGEYLPSSNQIQIDHIIRIASGGLIFSLDNYQLLCYECHQVKTSEERRSWSKIEKEENKIISQELHIEELTSQGQTFLDDFLQEES